MCSGNFLFLFEPALMFVFILVFLGAPVAEVFYGIRSDGQVSSYATLNLGHPDPGSFGRY